MLIKLISLKNIYILILIIALFVYSLSRYGYYITFVKPSTTIFALFLLTFFACYQLLRMTKLQKFTTILITLFIIFPILVTPTFSYILSVGIMSYDTIVSPDKSEELLIENKKIQTMSSEIIYKYNIYYKTNFPFVVKKVENGEIRIMTRDSDYDAMENLNVENATWLSGGGIIFTPRSAITISQNNSYVEGGTVKVTWDN